jgi:hypothetical protein
MPVFIAVLLSSRVDEFDVVCILPSNAGNVYYRIVCGVMFRAFKFPMKLYTKVKYTYIWIKN